MCNYRLESVTHRAPPSVAVPDGWKLVPVDPTDEMVRKSNWSGNGDVSVNEDWARKTVWDRMIYAAPSPDHIADAGKVVSENEIKAKGIQQAIEECNTIFRLHNGTKRSGCFTEELSRYAAHLRTVGDEGEE